MPARRRTNGGMVRDGIQAARSGAQVGVNSNEREEEDERASLVSSGTWHDLAVYVSE